jgi:hypothetical protein
VSVSAEDANDDLLVCYKCESCYPHSTKFNNDHGTNGRYVCKSSSDVGRYINQGACVEQPSHEDKNKAMPICQCVGNYTGDDCNTSN